jgi:Ca2+ transporting ATPase
MATLIKINGENVSRLHVKGASEIVLSKCKYFLNKDGNVVELSKERIDELIKKVVERMASEGLRTLCIAYRDFDSNHNQDDFENETRAINDLTCLCIVGIEDPVRPEVPDAIRKCQTSGVCVRMVTGDNLNTATSIALKCGIIGPGDDYLILDSKEFNKRIRGKSNRRKKKKEIAIQFFLNFFF